eukprot:TRINITY_DN3003_c0_g1_i1.p1 TRINITY_DN3003_c0_g1~~TRINITY_DN3003_c0_g1_i1.p1  ORF type:complete len:587 (+),score=92.62 TRINITY_DN3003_c0_g1_i1:137-1897(+)
MLVKLSLTILLCVIITESSILTDHETSYYEDYDWPKVACLIGKGCANLQIYTCHMISYENENLIAGKYVYNQTCQDLGFRVGRCCVDENGCFESSIVPCLLFQGRWSEGDKCPCEFRESCCVDGHCIDNTTEMACDALGGSYSPFSCRKNHCIEQRGGSCCDTKRCVPGLDPTNCKIDDHFINGTSCHANCSAVLPPPPSHVETGSCCYSFGSDPFFCLENADPDVCINEYKGYYQPNLSCENYHQCNPSGSCYRDGICLQATKESCDAFGGFFLFYGRCFDDSTEFIRACIFEDGKCNYMAQFLCTIFNGTWGDVNDTCPELIGSCCRDNGCEITTTDKCSIGNSNFHVGGTCNPDSCLGSCCIEGFCLSGIGEEVCRYNYEFHLGLCPSTGICNQEDLIRFFGRSVDIPEEIPININNVAVLFERSTFTVQEIVSTLTNISFTESIANISDVKLSDDSILSLKDSVISLQNMNVNHSVIVMDINSKISGNGILNILDSRLVVNLTDIQVIPGEEYILFENYSFYSGSFTLETISEQACVSYTLNQRSLMMVMSIESIDGCGESAESVSTLLLSTFYLVLLYCLF